MHIVKIIMGVVSWEVVAKALQIGLLRLSILTLTCYISHSAKYKVVNPGEGSPENAGPENGGTRKDQ